MSMSTSPIRHMKVTPKDGGGYDVELDGEDITRGLSGLQLTFDGAGPAHAMLRMATVLPEFDGMATIAVEDPAADARAVRVFVDSLDAAWLEQAMLEGADMSEGPGQAAVRAIREKARQEHGS